MASTLFRLGHLGITRTFCCKCGNYAFSSQLSRLVGNQQVSLPSSYLAVSSYLTAKPYSTPASGNGTPALTREETAEPDDLFRQVTVEIKCHDKAVMKSYRQYVTMAAGELGLNLARVFEPPKVIKRYTVLKSVHIYSKHMVQYEARTHFTVFELKHLTGSTADTFLEYIQRNLPEGMAMKVTKQRMEKIPDHLTPPAQPTSHTASTSPAS